MSLVPPEDRQEEGEEDLCVGNGDFDLEKKNTIMLCKMLRIRIRMNRSLLPRRKRKWNAYGSGSRFDSGSNIKYNKKVKI
jgi:hypothetical protein